MIRLDRRTTRVGLAVAASATLAFSLHLAVAAADDDAIACLDAGNVWVVVQLEEADVLADGCATEFGTGFEALTSAGIEFTEVDGFIDTIAGEPSDPGPEDWWSYWSGTPGDDDAVAWASYEVGAAESEPQPGTVEGWRLAHSWTEAALAPTFPILTPSEVPSPTPSASPSQTIAVPSASPTTTPTPSTPGKPSLPSTGN